MISLINRGELLRAAAAVEDAPAPTFAVTVAPERVVLDGGAVNMPVCGVGKYTLMDGVEPGVLDTDVADRLLRSLARSLACSGSQLTDWPWAWALAMG